MKIIPIYVKAATLLMCSKGKQRHPLVRALNLKFGIWDECQLVFRLYEHYDLRSEELTARLAIAGPEDGQMWEEIVHIEERYIPYLTAWKKRKSCKPFIYYFLVTKAIEERIKGQQHFFKRAFYPTFVGKGFSKTINKIPLCLTPKTESRLSLKMELSSEKSHYMFLHTAKPLKYKSLKMATLEAGRSIKLEPMNPRLSPLKKRESKSSIKRLRPAKTRIASLKLRFKS